MARKTIVLKDGGQSVREELVAVAAITPGMLVEITSADKVQKHSSAGQSASPMFAVEDELQGDEIGTDYDANALCQFNVFRSGDQVYAILHDGQNVAIGDKLESAGNGKLQKHTADSAGAVEYPNSIVGIARSALDLSDSSGADPASARIICQII